MFVLSLAGLAIFIFLLSLLHWVIQQWIIKKPGSLNEQIAIIVSSVTGFFAFLAAIAAIVSGWIFYNQLNEMREDRRAWVGPVSAGFPNGLPQVNNPGNVVVNYHNTGREPATDVFSDLNPYIATLAEGLKGIPQAHIAEQVKKCQNSPPVIGAPVVFPTTPGFSSYNTSRMIEGNLVDWDVLYGTRLIFITGCYVYNTLGATHRTSFCYRFQNGPNMTAKTWVFCSTGNYAD
jgi:hypothetical protein